MAAPPLGITVMHAVLWATFSQNLLFTGAKVNAASAVHRLKKQWLPAGAPIFVPAVRLKNANRKGKSKRMKIIGLTGGIASGKSTVAKMLEAKGAHLLDADKLAREAVEPGQPAWQQIVNWLGEAILLPDKNIDRLKLANLVFNDRRMLDKLNKIVHPYVGAAFLLWLIKSGRAIPMLLSSTIYLC
jgi:hypothetical protein